jgi:ring-1,2-phenylacetyl-CoA epoxidase subunit PaaE
MQIFHELEIANVQPNTKQAVLVEFAIPTALKENYKFLPGQHIVLYFKIERNNYRRTYSICSAPKENKLCISVKRQQKGIISNYINDAFFKGLMVKVSEPYGNFYADEQIVNASTIILWAGGSGITPMMGIVKHVLTSFPNKNVQLIYANRNDKCIMFEADIENLEKKFQQRFYATQILSNNVTADNIFTKLLSFTAAKKEWNGLTGHITPELIHTIVAKDFDAVHYICGPEKMMELCEQTLRSKGVFAVYVERFTGTTSIKNSNKDAMLKVYLHKKEYDIKLEENSLLEAILGAKLDPPYACKMGTCGSCKATLINGEVLVARDFALNEADRASGKILCCQTWAKSDTIAIEF